MEYIFSLSELLQFTDPLGLHSKQYLQWRENHDYS